MIFNKGPDGLIESVDSSDSDCEIGLEIGKFDATGDLSFILDFLVSAAKPALKSLLPGIVCPMLEDLVRVNLTEALQMANELIREYWNHNDPIELPVTEEMVDLHISPIVDTVRFLTQKFIGVDGPLNISYIVDIFSKDKSNLVLKDLYNKTLEFEIPIESLNATITLGIDNLIIGGLKTFRTLRLLDPVNYSNVTLDSFTDLDKLILNLTWYIVVDVKGETISSDEKLAENATFYVVLEDNQLNLTVQLASYDNRAQNYSNNMCLNTTCMKYLLSPNATGITYLVLHMNFTNITLSADSGDLEYDVRHLVNTIVALFVDNYKAAIPPFVNGVIIGKLLPMVNDLLADVLVSQCDYNPDNITEEIDVGVTTGCVGGAGALTALLFILPCTGFLRRKKVPEEEEEENPEGGAEMSDLASTYVDTAPTDGKTPEKKKENEPTYLFQGVSCGGSKAGLKLHEFLRTDVEGASMFFDPRLSLATRILIPLLLFVTIAMFISSNTGVGASVLVHMTLGSAREIELPSLFDFGLINSITEMWDAGVYPLSILVAFFSGIWPYLKVVMMILCWFFPQAWMSEKTRGKMLEWLDILGKWSLLDTYVMIMMLVAFHFDIEFPIVNSDDITKPTAVQIFVYPAYGFVSLIIATLVSLIMSHIILGLHRYIQPPTSENDCDDAQRWRPMILYCANSKDSLFRLISRIAISALLVVSLIMIILGTALNTFSFDFVGLIGWVLPMLGIDAHREYSVLSLTAEVPDSAQEPNSFTVRFTQIVFIMTAFVFPLIHVLAMLVLWFVPFQRKVQHYLRYVCEVLSAWACVDVFIISIIAAVLEIQQFADFMVGDKCDFLVPYIEEYLAPFVGDYPSCFEVVATLEGGCYVLFIGSIIYTAAHIIFMRVTEAGLRTRGNNGVPLTDEEIKKMKKGKKADNKPTQPEKKESTEFGADIAVSNKSFVASVSTLSIAATPNEAASSSDEVDERSDSSVDDLDAPGRAAPLPPEVDSTV